MGVYWSKERYLGRIGSCQGSRDYKAFRYMYPICSVKDPVINTKINKIVSSRRLYREAIRGLDKSSLFECKKG